MSDDGLIDMSGQRRFHVEPDDIAWRMRDDWLPALAQGYPIMLEKVIPYFEMEAASRLKREWPMKNYSSHPKMTEGYESWRLWWVKEASHLCEVRHPVGIAAGHLSEIGQAAVNIIMTASALREAIETKNAEQGAALGMLLLAEAMIGGYSLEFEAAKQAQEAINAAKAKRISETIGKDHEDLRKLKQACIPAAKRLWDENPGLRIGEVAQRLLAAIKQNKEKFPTLEKFPTDKAIKEWLKAAAAAGKLAIPPSAQARGRPPKSTK